MREIIYEKSDLLRDFEIKSEGDKIKIILGKNFDLKNSFNQEKLCRELGERLGRNIDYRDQNVRRVFEDHVRGLEVGKNRFNVKEDFLI